MENDPLAAYLAALARDDCYRVDEVLKTAPHETTEVVYFVGANAAELGPFVRKRIAVDAAMGDAYGHLFQAQRAGRRFRHLPRIYAVHTTGDELVVVDITVPSKLSAEERKLVEQLAAQPSFQKAESVKNQNIFERMKSFFR